MPYYLTRFSDTPAMWATLVHNPSDRRGAATQYIESVGGKLHGFWYAFSDHHAHVLWEAPATTSMDVTAIAISQGRTLSSIRTTVLLTVEEMAAAAHEAASNTYWSPGDEGGMF